MLTYPQLVAEIQRLSSEGQTGTIFIRSDDGHLVRIVLNEGKITYVVFDTKQRGYDAIPLIQKIRKGRLQFAEGVFETAQETPLPSTSDIIQMFTEDEDSPSTQTPSNIKGIIQHIKKALASHIGPIAMIVCDEYIGEMGPLTTVADVFAMLGAIAPEIGNPEEEKTFKEQLKKDMVKIGLI